MSRWWPARHDRTTGAPGATDAPGATREPPGSIRSWLVGTAVAGLGLLVTVGPLPALAGVVVALAVGRRSRTLLTASAVLLTAVVPMWFLGSSLPLSAAATRVQDNALVHGLAGVAVWLLSVAVVRDVAATTPREDLDGPG